MSSHDVPNPVHGRITSVGVRVDRATAVRPVLERIVVHYEHIEYALPLVGFHLSTLLRDGIARRFCRRIRCERFNLSWTVFFAKWVDVEIRPSVETICRNPVHWTVVLIPRDGFGVDRIYTDETT